MNKTKRRISASILSIFVIASMLVNTYTDTISVLAETVAVSTPSNADKNTKDIYEEIITKDDEIITENEEIITKDDEIITENEEIITKDEDVITEEDDIEVATDSNATKVEITFYKKLMALDDLDEIYEMILNADMEEIESLSVSNIHSLLKYVEKLNGIEEYVYYDDLVDTLYYISGESRYVESIYEYLETLKTLDEIYDTLTDSDNTDSVEALTFNEIESIRDKISRIYNNIEHVDEDDSFTFIEIEDILDHLQYDSDIETYTTYTRTWTGSVTSFTVASGDTYNVTVTGDTDLSGIIVVNGTLNIKSDGKASHKITRSSGSNMFRVQSGGKLVITGTSKYPLIIEGYDDASYATITCYTSTLDMDYVTMQNQNRTSGYGGAIQFGLVGTVYTQNATLDNVTINKCNAPEGAAMMFLNACAGTIDLTDCTIKNCTSTGTYGGTIRTQGNANCEVTIKSCTITDNVSSKNGAGVYWNARGSSAHLDITGTASKPTVIQDNEAVYGGGVFLSGQSIEIVNTHIIGNTGTYGGGICMQPYDYYDTSSGIGCDLTVGSGTKIQDNESSTYGGGVFMQIDSGSTTDGEDFEITIEDDVIISGNTAKYGGAFAVTQEIGNASYTAGATRKYNAYLKIKDGTIYDNSATENGGAFYVSREYGDAGADYELQVDISGGNIYNNTAEKCGGVLYMIDDASDSKACVNISGGTLGGDTKNKKNTAVDGGAIYIYGGSCTMSGGEVLNNSSTSQGGAIYVYGGDFTMSNGEINYNTSVEGGGVYVSGGNIDIEHGILNYNSATYGGAVYLSGDVDTNLTYQSGQMNYNTAKEDGGGIYATNGNLYIGLLDCTDSNNLHISGRYHPQIQNNTAEDCGGGISIADQGAVYFYCGEALHNIALYKGVGMNVFMDGGEFYYYDGAVIGDSEDPDLVIIGGELHDMCSEKTMIKIRYNKTNEIENSTEYFEGFADLDGYMNLPDAEYFWDADEGYRFIGWTPYGFDSNPEDKEVRDKDDYKPSGTSVRINDTEAIGKPQGTFDGDEDDVLQLYAIWAPKVNNIQYVDGATCEVKSVVDSENTPLTYNIKERAYDIEISTEQIGAQRDGFHVVGYYIYEAADKNGNWCEKVDGIYQAYEAIYLTSSSTEYENLNFKESKFDGTYMKYIELENPNDNLVLTVDELTFGDITLIPNYEIMYSSIRLGNTGLKSIDTKQSSVYHLKSDEYLVLKNKSEVKNKVLLNKLNNLKDTDLKLVFTQDKTSIKVNGLPLGAYSTQFNDGWSWRYNVTEDKEISLSEYLEDSTLENVRNKIKWMDGNSYIKGTFK